MPTLTPINFNPFDEMAPEVNEPKAELLSSKLFGDLAKAAVPGPMRGLTLPFNEKFREGFTQGFNQSGATGSKSMMEALENQYVPEGAVSITDGGEYLDKDGKVLFTQRRPNIIPITKKQDGSAEGAMPAMLDVWNTVGNPVASAGKGVTLGSGLTRQATKEISEMKAPTFYSAVENAVDKVGQNKASGDQWLATLTNQKGVKGEELEWTGLKEFLADKPSVTKAEVQDYLKNNKVELGETWKGESLRKEAGDKLNKAAEDLKTAIGPKEIEVTSPDGKTISLYSDEVVRMLSNTSIKPENLPKEYQQLGKNLNDAWNAKVEIGEKANTKYKDYQLPGGENYRELLLTLPDKRAAGPRTFDQFAKLNNLQDGPEARRLYSEFNANNQNVNEGNYKSSHWDEPNILAHMRMNDRTIDSKKSLHLEEIQSDWHQQGREKGYKEKQNKQKETDLENKIKNYNEEMSKFKDDGDLPSWKAVQSKRDLLIKELQDLQQTHSNLSGRVPDAPFKKNWHELALKRAIREAAENGYERLSWTPGEAQAARYDLSKQVDKIAVPMVNSDGTRSVRIDAKQGTPFKLMVDSKGIVDGSHSASQFSGKPLSDVVGKEMAEKIMKLEKADEFSGDGLKIGGEGMKGFYDQIIPKSVEKIAKEFGVKVQKGEVGSITGKITKLDNGRYKVEGGENAGVYSNLKDAEEAISETKNPVFYIDIPDNMRQSIVGKGQPLFSGVPTFTPVNYIPEFEEEKK